MTQAVSHRGQASSSVSSRVRNAVFGALVLASCLLVTSSQAGESAASAAAAASGSGATPPAASPAAVAPEAGTPAEDSSGGQAAPGAKVDPATAPAASPSQPAGAGTAKAADEAPHLEFANFNDQQFIAARHSGTPVVLYFEADWCGPCKKMHAETFHAPAVVEAAAGVRLFRVDRTNPDSYLGLVEKSFQVQGLPTVIFFGPDGRERGRRFGFIPPSDFVRLLDEGRKPAKSS